MEKQTNGRNRCDADEGEIRSRPPTESARCKTLFFCVFVFCVCVCVFCVLCVLCFVFMFCVYVLCLCFVWYCEEMGSPPTESVARYKTLPFNCRPDKQPARVIYSAFWPFCAAWQEKVYSSKWNCA